MGVHILEAGADDNYKAVLYDSVSGWAFGPVFGCYEYAERFIGWFRRTEGIDPREATQEVLQSAYDRWIAAGRTE